MEPFRIIFTFVYFDDADSEKSTQRPRALEPKMKPSPDANDPLPVSEAEGEGEPPKFVTVYTPNVYRTRFAGQGRYSSLLQRKTDPVRKLKRGSVIGVVKVSADQDPTKKISSAGVSSRVLKFHTTLYQYHISSL